MENIQYPNIQVSKGMAGWFAVMVWWNPEGFPEPFDTGIGRYALQSQAIAEGQQWAEAEGIPFYEPTADGRPARQDVVEQIREVIPNIQVIDP